MTKFGRMVSLGQKLKMPKRCEKRLYDHIRVVVCKKPLQNANTLQNDQFGSKIKNARRVRKTILQPH